MIKILKQATGEALIPHFTAFFLRSLANPGKFLRQLIFLGHQILRVKTVHTMQTGKTILIKKRKNINGIFILKLISIYLPE